ncbi:MAG: hypothetical protein JWP78_776 [Mucilaginibacter sp.]|nr:hypothetical protein [Mucilaginibacter sp.]
MDLVLINGVYMIKYVLKPKLVASKNKSPLRGSW